jgi:hypothetical protein
MANGLDRRLGALEALPVSPRQTQFGQSITPAEAYERMTAPGPTRPEPEDGLTAAERYMRMLNGSNSGGKHVRHS